MDLLLYVVGWVGGRDAVCLFVVVVVVRVYSLYLSVCMHVVQRAPAAAAAASSSLNTAYGMRRMVCTMPKAMVQEWIGWC